ncbi:SH3 domain-containing protein [Coxiella endosymbiont of Ornithodoros amblus]|uniref:SH3 domain-containing protein n=1 Tax=Coxiella endosymbiont of Ornithodoros amblus TaxID=1656166 RepID=UPI00244E533A|nr:SH3 domain-containing protein [Coxiella endosymbiont of Ornithodoros amblus]MBW5802788.1 SH3 domain-containing protein [Coxiella endosymbiont of Ornithodoros amblus]
MRRLLISLSIFLCILSGSTTYATTQQSQQSSPPVNLYEKPQFNAKILKTLSPTVRFIPIYHQKDWVKVGDPCNGEIGWVNQAQYQKALKAYYQSNVQTVLIWTEHNEQGKPAMDIVAYKDGKKLTDKESQKLYDQIKAQQAKEFHYMQRVFWHMDDLMAQANAGFFSLDDRRPWDDDFIGFGPTVVQPLIILKPSHNVSHPVSSDTKSNKVEQSKAS